MILLSIGTNKRISNHARNLKCLDSANYHQNRMYFFVVFAFRYFVQLNTLTFTRIIHIACIVDRCKLLYSQVAACSMFGPFCQTFNQTKVYVCFIVQLPETKSEVAKICKLRQELSHFRLSTIFITTAIF